MSDNNYQFPPNSIKTFTGQCFDLLAMDPETIVIEDIARALSMNCRWGGHTKHFYSIAMHSIHVCDLVTEDNKLAALMHDASEAYLLDIPKPFKNLLPDYMAYEDRLMRVIAEKYGFEYPINPDVKFADKKAADFEWIWLKTDQIGEFPPDDPEWSYREFLRYFNDWK